ncbi:hypothetical protein [Macrococcoides canis]|uniref:hypothetical protein n=1 Tax=Macrococcoides canis TaxID=1855823 RepID=UPI00130547C3|nr:hypothetical protein [Macrococcus canis]
MMVMFLQAYSKDEIKKQKSGKNKKYSDINEVNKLFSKHKPLVYLTDKDGTRGDK